LEVTYNSWKGNKMSALTDEGLKEIRDRLEASSPGPWTASVEGRDHPLGGETFIMRGKNREVDDLYLIGGTIADYDFVAHARQDIPLLFDEIDRLRKLLAPSS
jgi:hypothetical protein